MNKLTIISLLLLFSTVCFSQQRDEPDTLLTENGELIIQPITHGSLVLKWNDQVIYIDPYGGEQRFDGLKDPTLILITDIHADHLNKKTLDGLNTERSTIIAPQAVKDKLSDLQSKTNVIANGQTVIFEGIEILAIPMYNLPKTDDSRHPKGRGNGYVLSIGGKRIYISGDTEDIPEMRNLRNIDIAFVCMNLPYTMDINQAASAVNEFKPRIVYPYHYRGKDGFSDIESFKSAVISKSQEVQVRLKDWYPQ